MLHKTFCEGRIWSFPHPRGCPLASHLHYLDDILVFTNGETQSLKKLLLNKMKSTTYLSKQAKERTFMYHGFLELSIPLNLSWSAN